MRILICGTEKSGKSSLLRRLKGEPHQIEYIETKEEINGATVNWNYKATTEVIKVDAWEMKNDSYTQYYRGSSGKIQLSTIPEILHFFSKYCHELEKSNFVIFKSSSGTPLVQINKY